MKIDVLNPKEAKMARVAQSILQLIDLHGLHSITHARVAKAAKVSRPWLYKYLGTKRESLIEFAIDHYGKHFIKFENIPPGETEDQFRQILNQANIEMIKDAQEYPWAISIYAKYINVNHALGERLRYIEKIHVDRMTRRITEIFKIEPALSRTLAELLAAIRMGFVYRVIRYPKSKVDPEKLQKSMIELLSRILVPARSRK